MCPILLVEKNKGNLALLLMIFPCLHRHTTVKTLPLNITREQRKPISSAYIEIVKNAGIIKIQAGEWVFCDTAGTLRGSTGRN